MEFVQFEDQTSLYDTTLLPITYRRCCHVLHLINRCSLIRLLVPVRLQIRSDGNLRRKSEARQLCEHLNLELEWSDNGLTGNYNCIVCGQAVAHEEK